MAASLASVPELVKKALSANEQLFTSFSARFTCSVPHGYYKNSALGQSTCISSYASNLLCGAYTKCTQSVTTHCAFGSVRQSTLQLPCERHSGPRPFLDSICCMIPVATVFDGSCGCNWRDVGQPDAPGSSIISRKRPTNSPAISGRVEAP